MTPTRRDRPHVVPDRRPVARSTSVEGDRVLQVTAAVAGGAGSSGPPFANATPADIRAALTSEDAALFDEHWRAAMQRATERLDLAEVHQVLEHWRRIAWLTAARGQDGYRRMLAGAAETLRTRTSPAGSVSWSQLKAELGLGE